MPDRELLWYILSIKPKREETVIKHLDSLGIISYLPLCKKKIKKNKEKVDVVVPLFPGYLFCKFNFTDHYQKVRYTRGIKKVLGNKQSLWVISDERIEDIRSREENGVVILKKIKEDFTPGMPIVVDEGDFDGWEGIFFEDIPDEKRAVILLTNVNFTTKLTLPKKYLKSI